MLETPPDRAHSNLIGRTAGPALLRRARRGKRPRLGDRPLPAPDHRVDHRVPLCRTILFLRRALGLDVVARLAWGPSTSYNAVGRRDLGLALRVDSRCDPLYNA